MVTDDPLEIEVDSTKNRLYLTLLGTLEDRIAEAYDELLAVGVERVVRVPDDGTSAVVVNASSRRSRRVGYESMGAESVDDDERLLA